MGNFHCDSRWNARSDPEPLTTREKIVWVIAIIAVVVASYIVFAFGSSQQNIDIHVHCTSQLVINIRQVSSEFFNITTALFDIPRPTNDPITTCILCIMYGIAVTFAVAFYTYAFVVIGLLECHLFILSCLVHVS